MRVAASAMSQPGSTTAGDLPPSSSVTGVRCSAAVRITVRPTAGEPVNTMWSKGRAVNSPGSSSSSPTTATWSSLNASASRRRRQALVAGVASGIFTITRLPAASAAASGPSAR